MKIDQVHHVTASCKHKIQLKFASKILYKVTPDILTAIKE